MAIPINTTQSPVMSAAAMVLQRSAPKRCPGRRFIEVGMGGVLGCPYGQPDARGIARIGRVEGGGRPPTGMSNQPPPGGGAELGSVPTFLA